MKKPLSVIAAVILAIVFTVGSISAPFDSLNGYFGFHSWHYMIIRYIIIFVIIVFLTFCSRQYARRITIYSAIIILLLSCLMIIDYYVTKRFCHNFSYFLWVYAALCVTGSALFIGAILFYSYEDYVFFSKYFWYSFTPLYIYTLFFCFWRNPYAYGGLSVNLKLFHGTFEYFLYLFRHPQAQTYLLLVCLGNLFALTPLPFILKNMLKRLPTCLLIAAGIALPLLFEGYQYVFQCGNVDIDDLILNWFGFLIGYIILRLTEKRKILKTNKEIQ